VIYARKSAAFSTLFAHLGLQITFTGMAVEIEKL
jgi:hypothetical protein